MSYELVMSNGTSAYATGLDGQGFAFNTQAQPGYRQIAATSAALNPGRATCDASGNVTGAFTVEWYVNVPQWATGFRPWTPTIIWHGGGGSSPVAIGLRHEGGVTRVETESSLGNLIGSIGHEIYGTGWHHIAMTVEPTACSIYFDGTRLATGSRSGTLPAQLWIGAYNENFGLFGTVDDLRFTEGAIYTGASFTPPTTPLPVTVDTIALYRFNGDLSNAADGEAVPLAASAGADQSVTTSTSVTLHGSATGGTSPYTYAWTQTSGTAVTLSSPAVAEPIFTTPATTGTLAFQLEVTDGDVATDTDTVTVTVTTAPVAPTITTATLGSMTEGVAHSVTLAATGDTPITWAVASGALPAGLSLNTGTGAITGTPTTAGTGTATIAATNTAGSDSETYSWTVAAAPVPGFIDHTDPNIFYGPYSWWVDGDGHHPCDWGSYLRFRVKGTTTLTIPVPSGSSGGAYSVDHRNITEYNSTVTITGLTGDSHFVEIVSADQGMRFTGIGVDNGAELVPVATSEVWGLSFGDSITRGFVNDDLQSESRCYGSGYTHALRSALGAEVGFIAQNSRTYTSAVTEGYAFDADGWQLQRPGHTDLIDMTRPPDFVTTMVYADATMASTVIDTIENILDTLPNTKVFILRHVALESSRHAAADGIEPTMLALAATHPRVHYIDTEGWLSADDLPDEIHPSRDAHWAVLGPHLANAIRPLLYEPTVTFVPAASWPPAADPDPLHFYARVT